MIKEHPIVNCDNCKKDFKFKAKNVKSKIIDKVKVEYFICKHCQKKYISMCTDEYVKEQKAKIRSLENEIQKLAREFAKNRKEETLEEMDKLILQKDKLKYDTKIYIDSLKQKFKDKL